MKFHVTGTKEFFWVDLEESSIYFFSQPQENSFWAVSSHLRKYQQIE